MGFQNLTSGRRAAPSAGACYPLSSYAAIGKDAIEGIKEGVYFYSFQDHALKKHLDGDLRHELSRAALHQDFISVAPVSIIFTAVMTLTTDSYGERGIRYVYIDLGHAAQNVYLMAAAMGLGTVAVGAFQDSKVAETLSLSKEESPLYIMPIGLPK
jgi:SagB-type dehydrogenase family enzyme